MASTILGLIAIIAFFVGSLITNDHIVSAIYSLGVWLVLIWSELCSINENLKKANKRDDNA